MRSPIPAVLPDPRLLKIVELSFTFATPVQDEPDAIRAVLGAKSGSRRTSVVRKLGRVPLVPSWDRGDSLEDNLTTDLDLRLPRLIQHLGKECMTAGSVCVTSRFQVLRCAFLLPSGLM